MKKLLNHSRTVTPAGWLLSVLLAGAVLAPIQVITHAQAQPANRAPQVERSTADLTPASAPEVEARQRKDREARRTDPGATARVAAPPRPVDPQADVAEALTAELRLAQALAETQRQSALSDAAVSKRRLPAERLILLELENRIRALELELGRMREQNRKLDAERRLLELNRRKSTELDEGRRSDAIKTRDEVKALDERVREEQRRAKKAKSKSESGRVDGLPRFEALDGRAPGPDSRGPRVVLDEDVERDIDVKSLKPFKKGGQHPEYGDTRRDGQTKGKEGDRAASGIPGKEKNGDAEAHSPRSTSLAGKPLQLWVGMSRATPDGYRLMSTTDVTLQLGEWVSVDVPSGKPNRSLAGTGSGQIMRVRITPGKAKGMLFAEVHLLGDKASKVLAAKIGEPFRLVLEGRGDTAPTVIELKLFGWIGTAY